MFNRRMLVALAACLAISASSAMAGGGGGVKKNSTIEVHNETGHVIYAFANVSDAKIQAAAQGTSEAAILAAFKGLGGKKIEDGANAPFSVAAGDNVITAVAIDVGTQQLVGKGFVNVPKGATSVLTLDGLASPM